jgi:hypothetical protein
MLDIGSSFCKLSILAGVETDCAGAANGWHLICTALARVPNVSNKNAYTAREPKAKQSLVRYSIQFLVFEASKARDVAHWDSLDGG